MTSTEADSDQIEVLTVYGGPTGTLKPIGDVHRDGDWHRVVHVWVVTKAGRILLRRRCRHEEAGPKRWGVPVRGHVRAREIVFFTAIRKVAEVLGLRIRAGELEPAGFATSQRPRPDGPGLDCEYRDILVLRRDLDPDILTRNPDFSLVDPGDLRARLDRGDPSLDAHGNEWGIVLAALGA
jgi:isopentenyldiphosphate isomerase